VLDEHFARKWAALGPDWTRQKHRRGGGPVMKLVRYADDCAPRTLREVSV
jgi:RNA-directed DNA polymerase